MTYRSAAKLIRLDASRWETGTDFYDAILPTLGAPDWHGYSVNALVESMIWGDINDLEPPYSVEIYSTKNIPEDAMQELNWTIESFNKAKAEFNIRMGRDIDVYFQIFE